ncbi:MAG: hypothetical protein US51_C0054G0004 [Microgenomates group bacterium GW2011_GWA2_37_6]|nr:MAG: hypothetical protein US51_C0054G0004 [Microgenomates group bacterium GW2011_GWA2_37_6]
MKVKYFKEDDILVMRFSEKPVDDSFDVDNAILEVDKNKEPVTLEILHASKFLDITSKQLPKELKQKFFASV